MTDPGAQAVFSYYIGATLLLLLPGIAIQLWLRSLVRKTVEPVPGSIRRLWVAKIVVGLVLGQLLYLIAVLPAWIGGAFSPGRPGWESYGPAWDITARMSSVSLMPLLMFQSAYEELIFRAVILGLFGVLLLWLARLLFGGTEPARRGLGQRAWLAIGTGTSTVVAAAFALTHAGNPAVSGLALFNIALAGILLGLMAWIDGDIWGAWALHFSWNGMLALSGLPVSGLRLSSNGIASGAVPGLLSGGQFGPEGSLPATVAMLAGIAAVLWLAVYNMGQSEKSDGQNPPAGFDPPN